MVWKFLKKLRGKNKEPKEDSAHNNNGDRSHIDANQAATPPQTEIHKDTMPEVVVPQAESQTHAEPEIIAPKPAVQAPIEPEVASESQVRKQALGTFKTCLDLASIVLSALPIQAPKAAVDAVKKLVTDYEVSFPCDILVLALTIDGWNADHIK